MIFHANFLHQVSIAYFWRLLQKLTLHMMRNHCVKRNLIEFVWHVIERVFVHSYVWYMDYFDSIDHRHAYLSKCRDIFFLYYEYISPLHSPLFCICNISVTYVEEEAMPILPVLPFNTASRTHSIWWITN